MTKELIKEARRLEGDYSDNHEVMSHMSVLADALEAATRVPVQGEPNGDREALAKAVARGAFEDYADYPLDGENALVERVTDAILAAGFSRATVPDAATELRAERDAALAAIERIREAVSGHPECDRYSEGDVISCGWKSAYASVLAALAGKEKNDEKL